MHSKSLESSTHGGARGLSGSGPYGPPPGPRGGRGGYDDRRGYGGNEGPYGPGGGGYGMGNPMANMMNNPQMMAMRAAMSNMMGRGGYPGGMMMPGMQGGRGMGP